MSSSQRYCSRHKRLLGIDPGTAIVGYGVLDLVSKNAFECVASGVIRTPKELAAGERLKIIRRDFLELMAKYAPDAVIVEAIFFFKNAKTLIPVAQSRGVILEAAAAMEIPLFEYTPLQVKQNLTGYGRSDKQEMQRMVAAVLNHKEMIRPDDAADAVALTICHARMSIA